MSFETTSIIASIKNVAGVVILLSKRRKDARRTKLRQMLKRVVRNPSLNKEVCLGRVVFAEAQETLLTLRKSHERGLGEVGSGAYPAGEQPRFLILGRAEPQTHALNFANPAASGISSIPGDVSIGKDYYLVNGAARPLSDNEAAGS